jgi:hypothetical protein
MYCYLETQALLLKLVLKKGLHHVLNVLTKTGYSSTEARTLVHSAIKSCRQAKASDRLAW